MADHRRGACNHRALIAQFRHKLPRQHHRHRAFRAVEDQRRRRQPLAASAQHIGSADIARPDLAQVAGAEQACQDYAKGDRAEQITHGDQR